MVRDLIIGLAVLATVGGGAWGVIKWQRDDAVRDFVREAALVAAEKRAADQATKDSIEKEIGNASIDELRERAIAGGMFTDDAGSTTP